MNLFDIFRSKTMSREQEEYEQRKQKMLGGQLLSATTAPVLPADSALKQGRMAYHAPGVALYDNPYETLDKKFLAWLVGWELERESDWAERCCDRISYIQSSFWLSRVCEEMTLTEIDRKVSG